MSENYDFQNTIFLGGIIFAMIMFSIVLIIAFDLDEQKQDYTPISLKLPIKSNLTNIIVAPINPEGTNKGKEEQKVLE